MATALYPGSFDPVTLGHVDIAERAVRLFGSVLFAVGARHAKETLLTTEERVELVRESVAHLEHVAVEPFDGLVVDFARERGATVLVRGIRNPADYQYESIMAATNRRLAPDLETVFLVANPEHVFLSSSLIKEVLHAGGDVAPFVPGHVAVALRAKLG